MVQKLLLGLLIMAILLTDNFWKADNTVGGHSNGGLFQLCFETIESEYGDGESDIYNGQKEAIMKISYRAGLYQQAINNLSDFILPNIELTTTEKTAGQDYFKDIISNRMTEPVWRMMNLAKTKNSELYYKIKRAAELEYYEDPNLYLEVHDFLKENGIIKQILDWLKKERKKTIKEIKMVEKSFNMNNPAVKQGFDLWKESFVIMTHNKFIKQLKEDYRIK